MQSRNPILTRSGAFTRGGYATFDTSTPSAQQLEAMYQAPPATPLQTGRMTIDDVVAKTALSLLTVVVAGALAWFFLPAGAMGVPVVAALVGFVLALIISFTTSTNPALILTYAALEGVFLGAVSKAFNVMMPGIVVQAVFGTLVAFGTMLFLYKSRRIRVTPQFTKILLAAIIGFAVAALLNLVLGLFGVNLGLRDAGPVGLVFTALGVVLASLSLALDFHLAEEGVRAGWPHKMAWYVAFGLTVTLVWLYLEILRLIYIVRSLMEE
ncbi:hypothetical protein TH66_04830 [Carbonactinospora thermoautotrophica]|uniref:Putative integral membrane protein n=1 Tax=Carbonactinospora thermoautotrophica TaxID=1469144 RepID=A0A132N4X1_9ACTN|nr:Bax inhibitor-1/YccA family protein [Carbonactinospora thermoautotrophica]KWW99130.1 putative integral membrane protein [Carbonactinospora thermoautotrophica]KWX05067.1 hypothetical protein TH66_04830 [Carbonactinospora thermoautotrophica]KWX08122.1 hypothetical protein TR74_16395 [Carbonactinospora thermoautotrophica]